MSRWRVGRKLGRTLYRDDVCVGMVDTPELAAEIVVALNAYRGGPRCECCGDLCVDAAKDVRGFCPRCAES